MFEVRRNKVHKLCTDHPYGWQGMGLSVLLSDLREDDVTHTCRTEGGGAMTFEVYHAYKDANGCKWRILDRVNHVMLVVLEGPVFLVYLAVDEDGLRATIRRLSGTTTLYAEELE